MRLWNLWLRNFYRLEINRSTIFDNSDKVYSILDIVEHANKDFRVSCVFDNRETLFPLVERNFYTCDDLGEYNSQDKIHKFFL